jgi:hypothetical protein
MGAALALRYGGLRRAKDRGSASLKRRREMLHIVSQIKMDALTPDLGLVSRGSPYVFALILEYSHQPTAQHTIRPDNEDPLTCWGWSHCSIRHQPGLGPQQTAIK